MSTITEQIASQNESYRKSLVTDIGKRNVMVIQLMDETIVYKEEKQSSDRLEALNSFSPEQRRRLMSGEKLEDILGQKSEKESKYYNTSEEAAQHILQHDLFIYQIGDHLMAYETNDISIDEELEIIDLPVVIYDKDAGEAGEWKDMYYTIHNKDVFDILQYQLTKPKIPDLLPFAFDTDIDTNVGVDRGSPDFNTSITSNTSTKTDIDTIRRIQDKLYEQLLSIYQGESVFLAQVHSPQMEIRISKMLTTYNMLPFQIVNNLISEFTQ